MTGWRSVLKCLLVVLAVALSAQAASAQVAVKCGYQGTTVREYQIFNDGPDGPFVRVWLYNPGCWAQSVLVNVTATAEDGTQLRNDYPTRVNGRSSFFVDVPFEKNIAVVNYWFATLLRTYRTTFV